MYIRILYSMEEVWICLYYDGEGVGREEEVEIEKRVEKLWLDWIFWVDGIGWDLNYRWRI